MKEATLSERRMALACTNGVMAQSTEATGQRTTSKVSVSTNGRMEEFIRENGARTTCMGMDFTSTGMEDDLEVSSLKIRKKAMEFITGKTAASTKDTGSKASSMALESTWFLQTWLNSVFGRKARELSGTTMRKSKKSTTALLTIDLTLEMSNSTTKSSKRLTVL